MKESMKHLLRYPSGFHNRFNERMLDYNYATFQDPENGYEIVRTIKTKYKMPKAQTRRCGSTVLEVDDSRPENSDVQNKFVVIDIDNRNEILGVYDDYEAARADIRERIAD